MKDACYLEAKPQCGFIRKPSKQKLGMIKEKNMPLEITPRLADNKVAILDYFRHRGEESMEDVTRQFAVSEAKSRASALNTAVKESRDTLISSILQQARADKWSSESVLRCVLLTTYASYVSMIDLRNAVWEYEYMAFSRRIGELWEPFCNLCFEHSIKELSFFVPPLFSEVKRMMTNEIEEYINDLAISDDQKEELKKYYRKVWALVTSGEIKLELDLHFTQSGLRHNVDFKSGFGSNEKGNTNKLLLVATIYANLEQGYKCLLLVRSPEDQNNHYFQTLKNSGIWSAFCGDESYRQIQEFTGFDLKSWIDVNINWEDDLSDATVSHLKKSDLLKYVVW